MSLKKMAAARGSLPTALRPRRPGAQGREARRVKGARGRHLPLAHTHTPVLRHEKKEVSTAVSVGRPTTNQELHHNSSTNVIAMH